MKKIILTLVLLFYSISAHAAWGDENYGNFSYGYMRHGNLAWGDGSTVGQLRAIGGLTFYKDFTKGTSVNADFSLGSGVGMFTCTRTGAGISPGTYTNTNGNIIKLAAVDDVARINGTQFYPSGLTFATGLFMESEISNALTYSEDFTQAAWVKTDVIVDQTGKSNYETNSGTLFEGFEDDLDWTLGGTGGTVADDSINYVYGTQGVSLAVTATNTATIVKTINQIFSSSTNFSLWVYCADSNIATSNSLTIYLSSTADFSKYMKLYVQKANLLPGWNRVVWRASDMTNIGSDSWANAMIRFKLGVKASDDGDTSVTFDDFRYGYSGRPKIILCSDNAYKDIYNYAYPIAKERGIKMCIAANRDFSLLGIYNHSPWVNYQVCNEADLKKMYSDGWDIINHTTNHVDLTTESEADAKAAINDNYNWLFSLGFDKSAKIFAYPFATGWNDTVIGYVKDNHVLGRIWNDSEQKLPHLNYSTNNKFIDMRYKVQSVRINSYTTESEYKGFVDDVIKHGGLCVISMHEVTPNPTTSYAMTEEDFTILCDYIKTKVDDGLVDVVTFSEYLEGFEKNPEGNITDQLISATAANGTLVQSYVDASAGIYTASCFIKRKTGTGKIYLRANSGDAYVEKTSSVLSDKWTRIQSVSSSLTNPQFDLKIETSGDEVWIYGTQLEKLPYRTSYIPTANSLLTRSAETLKFTNLLNRNADIETVVIKFIPFSGNFANDSIGRSLLDTDTKRRAIGKDTTGNTVTFYPNITDSAASKAIGTTVCVAGTSYVVSGVAYGSTAGTNAEIYLNGLSEASGTTNYTIPGWGDYFYIGSPNVATSGTSRRINGVIQKVAFFGRALSESEISTVTNILNK